LPVFFPTNSCARRLEEGNFPLIRSGMLQPSPSNHDFFYRTSVPHFSWASILHKSTDLSRQIAEARRLVRRAPAP
jgi:hypothetical protein